MIRDSQQEAAYLRGKHDGETDPQPCELPPPEMRTDIRDHWTEGYRDAWKKRKGMK